jgi:hypothetical protein
MNPADDKKFALGEPVRIEGTVIARTEFEDGKTTYFVEYERKGKAVRDWFFASDIESDFDDE